MRKTAVSALALLALLAGCANPDAPSTRSAPSPSSPQNAGEAAAPAPPSAQAEAPVQVQPTPERALSAFGERYVNWSYRTLAARQRSLAAISVGSARLSEREAAAHSSADSAIERGHVFNRGQILGISPDLTQAGWWIIVTRERTGGSSEYEGLPAADHVTRAQLAALPRGYAVKAWEPQS